MQAAQAANADSDLYGEARPVIIRGYAGEAMEPCVSLDGQYLFFNDSNDKSDTHVYFAKLISDGCFDFKGEVPGLRGKSREMAPSLSLSDDFYFTSQRSYDKDKRSIYVGTFDRRNLKVSAVQAVDGDISPDKTFWINMDCAISADGKQLYLSRARFNLWGGPPAESDILLADRLKEKSQFVLRPQAKSSLAKINTKALEYAPAISADGLEFYFTRADLQAACPIQIMVARRKSQAEDFGAPQKLSAARGFCEAPSLTGDKSRLYFHKKVDNHYAIFVLNRRP